MSHLSRGRRLPIYLKTQTNHAKQKVKQIPDVLFGTHVTPMQKY